VLADTYRGPWVHDPGRVFTDLAAAVADGADCVSGVGSLVDQQVQHGPVASLTMTWRLLDQRVDAAHLPAMKAARAAVWAAGGAPGVGETVVLDVDASISVDHSDRKENAAATWKRTFGFHTLLVAPAPMISTNPPSQVAHRSITTARLRWACTAPRFKLAHESRILGAATGLDPIEGASLELGKRHHKTSLTSTPHADDNPVGSPHLARSPARCGTPSPPTADRPDQGRQREPEKPRHWVDVAFVTAK